MKYFESSNFGCPDWLVGDPDAVKTLPKKISSPNSSGVVQLDAVGKELARFDSIRAAGKATGANWTRIGRVAREGGTAGGYRWMYADKFDNPQSQPQI